MQPIIVTGKGQITIPKEIRKRLGLRKGSKVTVVLAEDRVEIRPVQDATAPAPGGFGMLKSDRPSVPADFDPATLFGEEVESP